MASGVHFWHFGVLARGSLLRAAALPGEAANGSSAVSCLWRSVFV